MIESVLSAYHMINSQILQCSVVHQTIPESDQPLPSATHTQTTKEREREGGREREGEKEGMKEGVREM